MTMHKSRRRVTEPMKTCLHLVVFGSPKHAGKAGAEETDAEEVLIERAARR